MRDAHPLVWLVVLMTLGLTAAPPAAAQDPIYQARPVDKLGRGVVNLLTGWIELPKQVHRGGQHPNRLVGLGRGLLRGAGLALLRSGVGLYETVTFAVPYPKGYASLYAQMELPDYAWK